MAYTDYKFVYGIGPDGLANAVRAGIANGYQPFGSPMSEDNNPNLMLAMVLGTPDTPSGEKYTLPVATADTLGGIKIGNNLSIDKTGVVSSTDTKYVLPTASADTLGGVKVGNNLSIADGVLSSTDTKYTLPTASADTLGGIKIGANLSIDNSGVVSSTDTKYTLPAATTSAIGGVKAATAVANAGLSAAEDVATLVTDHNALAAKFNKLIAALVASGAMVAGG